MAYDTLVSALRHVELFDGLSEAQMVAIARAAERIVFKPGAIIIEDGARGEAAYLIVAGEAVRLASPAEPHAVENVPRGSLVGEMAMLIEVEHSSTIAALNQVRALKLSRGSMHALMLADPKLADHLVARIAARLHGVLSELSEVDRVGFMGAAVAIAAETAMQAPLH